jgi:thiol-disulfide isomerase/thioredoxin
MAFSRCPRIRIAFFVAVLGAALTTYTYANDLATSANIFMFPRPYPVSNLVLKAPDGRTVSLSDYRGKVVLLHFWSINCPACRFEEPLLHQLRQTFPPSDLEILGVNLVDPPQTIISHAMVTRMPFPVLFDGGQGYQLKVVNMAGKKTAFVVNPKKEAILEVPGFPTTYILDGGGNVVGYSVGAARWNQGSAVALLRSLVAQRKSIPQAGGPVAGGERYSMGRRQ